MLKQIVAFQRLFLNSTPSQDLIQSRSPVKTFTFIACFLIGSFLLARVFGGVYWPIILALSAVWMVNRNLNGDQRLFALVPVGKKFLFANIYLAGFVFIGAGFLALWAMGLSLAVFVFSMANIFQPENVEISLPESYVPAINVQGSLFILLVMIIIVVVGITIALLKTEKERNIGFISFFVLGYTMLSFLKSQAPDRDFIVAVSSLPWINELLLGLGMATIGTVVLSQHLGRKLFLAK